MPLDFLRPLCYLQGVNRTKLLLSSVLCLLPAVLFGQYLITTPDSLMTNHADYLVITHSDFTNAMYPLCRLRESLGLEVKMAEVGLIYSTFNSGPRTDRIKAFLQRVYDNWTRRPTYVLLVGDACKDSATGQDFVPVKLFPKFSYSYYGGLAVHGIDNWYAQLEGHDSIPDMIVGRLPVNTAARCESLVSKILRYEAAPDTGQWIDRVLLASSDDRAIYATHIDTMYLRSNYDSVYRVRESDGSSTYLRQKMRAGFNLGVSLVCAVSHGSQPPCWLGSKTLFSYQDVDSLRNIDRLPVVLGRG
jgi:hypothetical protein